MPIELEASLIISEALNLTFLWTIEEKADSKAVIFSLTEKAEGKFTRILRKELENILKWD